MKAISVIFVATIIASMVVTTALGTQPDYLSAYLTESAERNYREELESAPDGLTYFESYLNESADRNAREEIASLGGQAVGESYAEKSMARNYREEIEANKSPIPAYAVARQLESAERNYRDELNQN